MQVTKNDSENGNVNINSMEFKKIIKLQNKVYTVANYITYGKRTYP
jgi:hypothetical protein